MQCRVVQKFYNRGLLTCKVVVLYSHALLYSNSTSLVDLRCGTVTSVSVTVQVLHVRQHCKYVHVHPFRLRAELEACRGSREILYGSLGRPS